MHFLPNGADASGMSHTSYLFITLDSCRYDSFSRARIPNMKGVGPCHRAMAPGNNTFSSHMAMFVGFTPGIAGVNQSFLNPKFGRIFKMVNGGFQGRGTEHVTLEGENIIDGFKKRGFRAVGTGAVGWFDPGTDTGKALTRDFDEFFFPGNTWSLERQVEWVLETLPQKRDRPAFVFMNIGETHVPYYFKGAPWSPEENPCIPFSGHNNAEISAKRQRMCLEFVDSRLKPVLDRFRGENILICGDHGDCWGEDGLWEHGIHHEMVYAVPLLFSLTR